MPMTDNHNRSNAAATDEDEDDEEVRAECPFCGSTDTELESAFGSEVSKSQYWCRNCRTVFERLKYDGRSPDTGR